ncbi:sodium:solute symporter family transporter [Rhodopirellula sallentina]|uniref:Na+/solute symporter n=1 Tax=Rhodopirellula sallentina SM41 TaxID=1263870 RepID=M5TS04_9BACT|nr:Na+/solute symporter [Rhodopirellula sallentina]EMI51940.1 Na+/solute symporter [Rhodopirellula sallentina SM41]
MASIDYAVLLTYLAGVFGVGCLFAAKNKSTSDMFAAGGQSPWWASGLSAFMTMFSANTFVVWGGIAYRQGLVAVSINLMYGVAALLVGYFVAGRWKQIGVQTPAEYVQLRFGHSVLHFYTWFMTVFRIVTTAGALYALGRVLVSLMPLAEGNPLRDPATGTLSLFWGIVIFSSIVVIYTMIGGLWAVLMTDVLQFIILNLAVLFVIPLALAKVGGVGAFWDAALATPALQVHAGKVVAGGNLLSVISGDYTWFFLAGWCAVHFFMIGAEWAFVQRFICVPDANAARKSTYLFGGLYLLSPLLWLLPPLIWRVHTPIPAGASEDIVLRLSETAYIDACQSVLPVGMVGLMVAAMFSATASMVSSQLNVFSGVITHDIYRPLAQAVEGDPYLVWVGRVVTSLLGALLIAIALFYESLGGAEKVIINITEMVVVALFAPTLWSLFSRTMTARGVWITAGVSLAIGVVVRFGLQSGGLFTSIAVLEPLAQWVQANSNTAKTFTGVVIPVFVLAVMQFFSGGVAAGHDRVLAKQHNSEASMPVDSSRLPAVVVGGAIAVCGLLMFMLMLVPENSQSRMTLGGFGSVLVALAILILWVSFSSYNREQEKRREDLL